MAWKTMDIQEQRVRFVVAASREEKSLTALCQEFGISRPTGMLWKRRYRQRGLAGIAEHVFLVRAADGDELRHQGSAA